MLNFHRLLTLAGLTVLAPSTFAVPVSSTLALTDDGVNNKITISLDISATGSGNDVSNLAGTIEVDWDIDPVANQVSQMTFTSGDLTGSAVTLAGRSRFGASSHNFNSSVIGATVVTTTPPGLVTPASGTFDASQHEFEINQGTVGGTVSLFGTPVGNESVDFGADPVSGAGSGNGSVTLTEISSTATTKTYNAVVELDVSLGDVTEVTEPIEATITIAASGRIKATGEITVPLTTPSPYELWATANGIDGALFNDDANQDGVSNGIVWALGLSPDEDPLPYLPVMVAGNQAAMLMPASGTAAELTVETSSTLQSADWTPLASESVVPGTNPISPGTKGILSFTLPPGDSVRVLRLRVAEP